MNLDLNNICRLCLQFCKDYIDLTNSTSAMTIAEKIRFCYFVQVDSTEPLPTKVCYQCAQVLTYFYMTKKNVIASDQMLRNIVYIKHKLGVSDIRSGSAVEVNVTAPNEIEQIQNNENSFKHLNLGGHYKMNDPTLNTKVTTQNDSVKQISHFISHNNFKRPKKDKIRALTLQHRKKRKVNLQINMEHLQDSIKLKLNKQNNEKSKLKENIRNGMNTETEEDSKEKKIVKVIGTVIDQNNILSPHVKRSRKSVSTNAFNWKSSKYQV